MTSTLLPISESIAPYLATGDRAPTVAFTVAAAITLTRFIIGVITRT